MNDYYKALMLMDNLNNFIRIVSLKLSIEPSEFYIAGGFARRMYMLKNNIPMTESDRKALHTSDVDVFCDARIVLDDILKNVETLDINQFKQEIVKSELLDLNKTQQSNNDNEKDEETYIRDKLSNKFHHSIYNVVEAFDEVLSGIENTGIYTAMYEEQVSSSLKIQKDYDYDLSMLLYRYKIGCENCSSLFEYLGMSKNGDKEFSVSVDKHKSFGISHKNISFTVPLCDTIQFIFKYKTVDEIINEFDMDIAKFKIPYPFDINNIIAPNIDVDSMYTVYSVNFGNHSPFRLIDRLQKYSSYGFTFSSKVKSDLDKHIDQFVDDNKLEDLSTYKNGIY